MKRVRRGATKLKEFIYRDRTDGKNKGEAGGGGKAGSAEAKDNNGVVDDNNTPSTLVYVKMDPFAKKREVPPWGDHKDNVNGVGSPKKRRRKRLVEKTTMEDKGYLHTDTILVWEDIESADNKEIVDKDMGMLTSASWPRGRND